VELKRAKRQLSVHELAEQGNKYRTALIKCLRTQNIEYPHISIVFVIGTPLSEEDDPGGQAMIAGTLNAISGRVTHYEALIDGARAAYGDFLVESAKADKIDRILQKLE
jgi:hypothetical protein